jgi:transposase-like zinc ribbon protein
MREGMGPRTLMELQARFPDEAACVAFLRAVRWPKGFVCPRCEGRASWTLRTRRLEQCRSCRHQTSLTAGTVLHRTRLPLRGLRCDSEGSRLCLPNGKLGCRRLRKH